jgi:hypothetical protein
MIRADGSEIHGRAIQAEGKTTKIKDHEGKASFDRIQRICVVGRKDPTASERACKEFILLLLRGERKLRAAAYNRLVWFPSCAGLASRPVDGASQLYAGTSNMNESQRKVVQDMVQGSNPVVIVHG